MDKIKRIEKLEERLNELEKRGEPQEAINQSLHTQLARLEGQVSNLNTLLRDAEKLSCRIQMLELKNREPISPVSTSDESGMTEDMKQKLITAHLVTAIRTMIEKWPDNPRQSVEDKLGKIDELCNNPPAPVSDGKSGWSIDGDHVCMGKIVINYNGIHAGEIGVNTVSAFRTLIAREKLCKAMYNTLKSNGHVASPVWILLRDTLIAEYEALK